MARALQKINEYGLDPNDLNQEDLTLILNSPLDLERRLPLLSGFSKLASNVAVLAHDSVIDFLIETNENSILDDAVFKNANMVGVGRDITSKLCEHGFRIKRTSMTGATRTTPISVRYPVVDNANSVKQLRRVLIACKLFESNGLNFSSIDHELFCKIATGVTAPDESLESFKVELVSSGIHRDLGAGAARLMARPPGSPRRSTGCVPRGLAA